MGIVRNYTPGYTGTAVTNGNTYAMQGWKSKADPGLWDATNFLTGGWMWQEVGIQKITFDFTIVARIPAAAVTGANPTPAVITVPDFKQGDTITGNFTINGVDAYVGQVIITNMSVNVDIKGGVTFDFSADSQGPMTGSLAVTPAGT